MRYQYTFRTTAGQLWQLSMYHIYGSMVGVCNLIFTVGMAALIWVRWETSPVWMRALMMLGFCLFPVFQPLAVYRRAAKQAAGIIQDTTIVADGAGLCVTVGNQRTQIPWKAVKRISKKPTMIVVFSDATHGFLLSNRILGKEKEEFYRYVSSRMGK